MQASIERTVRRAHGLGWWLRVAASVMGVALVALLSGLPQHLYHLVYDALAFPVAALGNFAQSLRHGGSNTSLDWERWMADPESTYAALQGPAYRGSGGMLVVELVILLVLPGVVLWRVTWFVVTRMGRIEPGTPGGSSRWMNEHEIRDLSYAPGALLLGQTGRHQVGLDRRRQTTNCLIVGPPNSGKSAGFIIPNLLREPGTRSLLITDLKGELLEKTGVQVSQRHEVWVVNVLSPATSCGYNPLAYCSDEFSTMLFADAWINNTGKSENEPFWDNATRELLVSGIVHLKALLAPVEPTLLQLEQFLCAQAPLAVIKQLEQSPAPLAQRRAKGFFEALVKNDKLLGSVFSEVTPRLMLLADPRVQATTSTNEVDFSALVDPARRRPIAIYLTMDRTLQQQLRPLFSAFFLDFFRTLSQLADAAPGGQLGRDVVVYADEFGNIGTIPNMATWMSTMRSAGVAVIPVVQATSQGEELYGPTAWTTIKGSCATKIGLANMGDADCKWFSELCGQTTVVSTSASQQRGRFHLTTERGTRSEQETSRALLTADEVRRLPEGELLAIVGGQPPLRLAQRRYYADGAVRHLATPSRPPRRTTPLTPPDLSLLRAVPPASSTAESGAPEHAGAGGDNADAIWQVDATPPVPTNLDAQAPDELLRGMDR